MLDFFRSFVVNNALRMLTDGQEKYLLDWRESHQDVIRSSETEFDSKITYVGSGAAVLTITFVGNLQSVVTWRFFLLAGVLLIVLAVVLNLGSFLYMREASKKRLAKIDNYIKDQVIPSGFEKEEEELSKKAGKLNSANYWILVSGVVLDLMFVFKNLAIYG